MEAQSPESTVTYDMATLTFREVLRAHLRTRYPRVRYPITWWLYGASVVILALAVVGFILGMAAWPRLNLGSMALGFGIFGAIVPVLTLSAVQRALSDLRTQGNCTTELTEEGIRRRTEAVECKYRWISGQQFLLRGDDLLLFVRRGQLLWVPRRAFRSNDVIDFFLQTACSYHAKAMDHGGT